MPTIADQIQSSDTFRKWINQTNKVIVDINSSTSDSGDSKLVRFDSTGGLKANNFSVENLEITSKTILLNQSQTDANNCGLVFEESGNTVSHILTSDTKDGFNFKAANSNNIIFSSVDSNSIFSIDSNTALQIPFGSNAERSLISSSQPGFIRFNVDDNTFEGYDGTNWGSLGGVKDVNQDTYITAEETANDDTLRFYSNNVQRMYISNTGIINANTANGLVIPVGNTSISQDGSIRYNDTDQTYEGYSNGNWGSLGGVKDIDQDTYIDVEETADEDTLRFYANNKQLLTITENNLTANNFTDANNNSFLGLDPGNFTLATTSDSVSQINLETHGTGDSSIYITTNDDTSNAYAGIIMGSEMGSEKLNLHSNNVSISSNTLFFSNDQWRTNGNTETYLNIDDSSNKSISFGFGNTGIPSQNQIDATISFGSDFGLDFTGDISRRLRFDRNVDGISNTVTNSDNELVTAKAVFDQVDAINDTIGNLDATQIIDSANNRVKVDIPKIHMDFNSSNDVFLLDSTGFTFNANTSFSNNVIIDGDLTVSGNNVIINTTSLEVEDANITLNKNGTPTTAQGAGIEIDSTSASIKLNSTLDYWEITSNTGIAGIRNPTDFIVQIGSDDVLKANSDYVIIDSDIGLLFPDLSSSGAAIAGTVRYNSSQSRFEGYSNGAWQGLGGVIDINQDTYVSAANSISQQDDQLRFVTQGVERLIITDTGVLNANTANGFILPVGTSSERETLLGSVRYNTEQLTFEGCDGTNWGSLGGVIDIDKVTHVTAANSVLDQDRTIRMVANTNLVGKLTENTYSFISNTSSFDYNTSIDSVVTANNSQIQISTFDKTDESGNHSLIDVSVEDGTGAPTRIDLDTTGMFNVTANTINIQGVTEEVTVEIFGSLSLNTASFFGLPVGNTTNRPSSNSAGYIRYNTEGITNNTGNTLPCIEYFDGTDNSWKALNTICDEYTRTINVASNTFSFTANTEFKTDSTNVYLNGILVPRTDYSIQTANTITFDSEISVGNILSVHTTNQLNTPIVFDGYTKDEWQNGLNDDIKIGATVEIGTGELSTSTTTGALVVDGGVGITQELYVGSSITELSAGALKTNITPIDNALSTINSLQGVYYDWKEKTSKHKELGLIAEQVSQIFPNAVSYDKEEKPLGVKYTKLVALLIEGMKEQQTKIDKLESAINALTNNTVDKFFK